MHAGRGGSGVPSRRTSGDASGGGAGGGGGAATKSWMDILAVFEQLLVTCRDSQVPKPLVQVRRGWGAGGWVEGAGAQAAGAGQGGGGVRVGGWRGRVPRPLVQVQGREGVEGAGVSRPCF